MALRSRRGLLTSLAITALLVLSACGSDAPGGSESTTTGAPAASGAGSAGASADATPGGSAATAEAPAAGTPVVGGVLQVGVAEDFDAIDPAKARGETSSRWEALVYETLLGVTKEAQPAPGLATDWEISKDGLTYTFNLAPDAKFSNGEDVTSESIKWNYEHIADPATTASQQSFYAQIESMDATNPKKLVLKLKSANASFLGVLALQGRSGIQWPGNYDAAGERTSNIGSGPYIWTSYKASDRLVLTRNADYWTGKPAYIEEINVRILPNGNTRLQALATGDLDLAFGLDAAQAKAQSEQGAFDLQQSPQNRGNYFVVNTTKAPFSDVRLRKAMQLAVSREDIAASGWNGFAVPTDQPFDQASPWYVQNDFPVTGDIPAATALVKEAGAEGTVVKILAWDALGSEQEAQIVAAAWTEIGLKPEIQKVDIATVVSSTNSGDFDVAYLYISLITDPARPYAYFDENNATPGLVGLFKSPELTDLVAKGLTTTDAAARKDIYAEILNLNYENALQYYTVNPMNFVGVGKRLLGYVQGTENVIYQGGGLFTAYLEEN